MALTWPSHGPHVALTWPSPGLRVLPGRWNVQLEGSGRTETVKVKRKNLLLTLHSQHAEEEHFALLGQPLDITFQARAR